MAPLLDCVSNSYAVSECSFRSMPSTSASPLTRKPIVLVMTQPRMNATVNEYANTLSAATACLPNRVPPPPKNSPFVAAGLIASVEKKPRYRQPMIPPTRCTPMTSSESSYPSLYFNPTASAQTEPAIRPSRIAVSGVRNAHAGVMATRPATAPEAAPTLVGRPSRIFSTISQAHSAAAVATWVFMNAIPARLFAANAEPALNPNQPNHSRPAPNSTNGTLCGRSGSLRKPIRLPNTRHNANAAAPALMCTAVPPAKSSTPQFASQLPPLPSVPKSNTQCATGKYTMVVQIVAKIDQERNFVRSAIDPEINAGVMIANINWNAANTIVGT